MTLPSKPPSTGHNSLDPRALENLRKAFSAIARNRARISDLSREIADIYAEQAVKLGVDTAALRDIERWMKDPLARELRDEQVQRLRPGFGTEREQRIAEREALRAQKEAEKEARKAQKTATGTASATRGSTPPHDGGAR